jgi:Ribonuclease G/E
MKDLCSVCIGTAEAVFEHMIDICPHCFGSGREPVKSSTYVLVDRALIEQIKLDAIAAAIATLERARKRQAV